MRVVVASATRAALAVCLLVVGCRLDLGTKPSPINPDSSSGNAPPTRTPPGQTEPNPGVNSGSAGSGARRNTSGTGLANVSCENAARVASAALDLNNSSGELSGVITVTGAAVIKGTIEIAPGTTFVIQADSSLTLGSGRSTLSARGTPDQPIRFCGASAAPGFWQSVTFDRDLTTDSIAENLIVADGGGKDAAVWVNGPVRVTNLTILDSKNDGLAANDFGENSRGVRVERSGRDAVVLGSPGAVDSFPTDASFVDNRNNVVRLTYNNIDGVKVTLRNLGVPYIQNVTVEAHRGANVVFEAGVEYQFAADTLLGIAQNLGSSSSAAEIHVNGTAAEPVVFRGVTQTKGFWRQLKLQPSTSRDSTIKHLRISDVGFGTDAALWLSAEILLEDVQLQNAKTGIYLGAPLNRSSTGLSASGVDDYPLVVDSEALVDIPTGGSFIGNATGMDMVHVLGQDATLVGTIRNVGVPYLISAPLGVNGSSDLTIAPGVELVFASDAKRGLDLGLTGSPSKLTIAGTVEAPVVLRGEKDEPGSWTGLWMGGAVSLDSRLDYVQLQDAGARVGVAIPITHSSFSKSPGFGIAKHADNTLDYSATNTFTDNASGAIGEL